MPALDHQLALPSHEVTAPVGFAEMIAVQIFA
jgi:hypothetical protein